MILWSDIQHFRPDEFACACGTCGSDGTEMDIGFVHKLDQLRERTGFRFVINSGYRCSKWNEIVSTTGAHGPHTTGRAADIRLWGYQVHKVLQTAVLGGWMTGIGLHQKGPHGLRFLHLDDLAGGGTHRPAIWTY